MMNELSVLISSIIASLSGAGIATYFIARLRMSGSIKSTEATILWEAQENFRLELTQQVNDLKAEIVTLRQESQKKDIKLAVVHRQVEKLEWENQRLREARDQLTTRIEQLERNGKTASNN